MEYIEEIEIDNVKDFIEIILEIKNYGTQNFNNEILKSIYDSIDDFESSIKYYNEKYNNKKNFSVNIDNEINKKKEEQRLKSNILLIIKLFQLLPDVEYSIRISNKKKSKRNLKLTHYIIEIRLFL